MQQNETNSIHKYSFLVKYHVLETSSFIFIYKRIELAILPLSKHHNFYFCFKIPCSGFLLGHTSLLYTKVTELFTVH